VGQENIKLGVCSVTLNGVDLGLTKGGTELTYKGNWHAITVDQAGTTKIKKILIGEEASVKTNLAEDTLDNLVAALGGAAQKITDGAKHKVIFGRTPGFEATSYALVLHPIAAGASLEEDVTIYKASGNGDLARAFQLEGERIIPVTFEALADLTRTDGDRLMCIGDSSAALDLVAPTVSSTTPADAAVGVDKAVTTTIQVNFDKAMNPATIVNANLPVFREDTYAQIAGAWSYVSAQNRAVFTADEQWPASTKIVYVVTRNVKSVNNVALAAAVSRRFTTGA
jgi:hypothetical protein